jgi:hypothetical protein|nr:MAG TPA: Protein of unknown function (DUF1351) [Caudoviricetes sp.]
METKELIAVQQLPVIAEQLAALRADVLAQTSAAVAMEATEETRKDIKAMRAALNKQYKELEERRIAVKKEILKPYEAFEQIYRQQIGSLFTDADAQLAAKIRRVEAGMKHKLEQDARAYFSEYAAFRPGPEQDYMQEQLDGALREIFGEATVPFAVRHPYIREIDYTKKRR